MKLTEKADIYLLVLLFLGLFYALVVHEWHEKKHNHVIVVNNSQEFDWINITCVPKDICHFWMKRGEVHHYDNMRSLEFSIDRNNIRSFFSLTIPKNGTYTLNIKELLQGKYPSQLKLECSQAEYSDYYQKRTVVSCPKPELSNEPTN